MRNGRPIVSACALSLPLVVLSCVDDPAAPSNGEGPPPTPTVEPALVEITISGIGTAHMAASAAPYGPRAQGDVGLPAGGAGGPSFTLTPIGGGDGSIQIDALSTGSFTAGERGAGGVRYVSATFRVRNAQTDGTAYTTPRQNLTFVAVDTDGTIDATPISSMRRFDGSDAADAIALEMVPTGKALLDPDGAVVPGGPDVFQAFTEAEVETLDDGSATINTVFPYGFVVRNAVTPGDRTLPANPAVDAFDGLVTFGFTIPLQASPALDPFEVSVVFLATDDDVVKLTESLEERTPAGTAALNARADAMSAPIVTVLGTSETLIGPEHAVRRICRLRVAGTDPENPLRTLVDGGEDCEDGGEDLPSDVVIVDDGAAGGLGDGSSWTDAFTSVQDALACIRDADPACAGVDEIWIAASDSAYYPDDGAGITQGDETATFELIEGVGIYGGFAGGEYARQQRDPDANSTIMSGDIDHDDPNADGNYILEEAGFAAGTNTLRLLTAADSITSATVLDGLVITAADQQFADGGGLLCTADPVCSPTLRHLLFSGNAGRGGGGAVFFDVGAGTSESLIEDVVFRSNASVNNLGGGGLLVALNGGSVNLSLVRTDFIDNLTVGSGSAGQGGALDISGTGSCDVRVANSRFVGNEALSSSGGAVWIEPACRFEAQNVLFAGNVSGGVTGGGAIGTDKAELVLDNVTIADNQADTQGAIVFSGPDASGHFTHVIILGNDPDEVGEPGSASSVVHSIMPGTACPANFTCTDGVLFEVDPEFRDPAGDDYRLEAASVAIDAGDNAQLPDDVLNLDGNPRVRDGGGGAIVDLGAYERQ